jgi:hypothetical protein
MSRHPDDMSGQAIEAAYRDLRSFYVRTYHIKDPLKQDAASLGLQPSDIEDAISNDSDLALLADLANLDKHFKLNKRPRSGAVPNLAHVQGVRAGSGEGGWRLDVKIRHGARVLDGLEVAEGSWRRGDATYRAGG